ncbi:hypothetical protein Bpfe_020184 [Biomphalaria pfeifferi]|uniref:Uncharacterized protein n=1 Tax=Biomphalaria pfeifferi TaxID=112525 RepID=A0AAD8F3U1_BIOPF|nr:hypothetical protein Bpfe_020184 [Biomphalaria pfeifferi]
MYCVPIDMDALVTLDRSRSIKPTTLNQNLQNSCPETTHFVFIDMFSFQKLLGIRFLGILLTSYTMSDKLTPIVFIKSDNFLENEKQKQPVLREVDSLYLVLQEVDTSMLVLQEVGT